MERFENMYGEEDMGIPYETMGKLKMVRKPEDVERLSKEGWRIVKTRRVAGRTVWIMREPKEPRLEAVMPPPFPKPVPKPIITPILEEPSELIILKRQVKQLKKLLTASEKRYKQLKARFDRDRKKYIDFLNDILKKQE